MMTKTVIDEVYRRLVKNTDEEHLKKILHKVLVDEIIRFEGDYIYIN